MCSRLCFRAAHFGKGAGAGLYLAELPSFLAPQASSADLANLHRPQLHTIGSIAWGYVEAFFLQESDRPKDASMEATVVSRMLDFVEEKCAREGKTVPRTLIISADNTAREAKNTTFLMFCAFLKASCRFDTVQVEFMRSGHTHCEQERWLFMISGGCTKPAYLEPRPESFNGPAWNEQWF